MQGNLLAHGFDAKAAEAPGARSRLHPAVDQSSQPNDAVPFPVPSAEPLSSKACLSSPLGKEVSKLQRLQGPVSQALPRHDAREKQFGGSSAPNGSTPCSPRTSRPTAGYSSAPRLDRRKQVRSSISTTYYRRPGSGCLRDEQFTACVGHDTSWLREKARAAAHQPAAGSRWSVTVPREVVRPARSTPRPRRLQRRSFRS